MTPAAAYQCLLREVRALVAATPELRACVGTDLKDLPLAAPEPRPLPMLAEIGSAVPDVASQPLAHAIQSLAPLLHWQQSYTEAQVGAHHLAHYGWFNLVSPDGAFLSQRLRVSVGYWGHGLSYPPHHHAPEETYCVLAGSARFETQGRAPVEASPGTVIHHPPNVPHGIEMHSAPLLAMAVWRGEALNALSTLEAHI